MKLGALNQVLANLQIGKVDPLLASRTISLYGGYGKLGVSMDAHFGTAFENVYNEPNAYLSLEVFSFGGTFFAPLFQYRSFAAKVLWGFNFTDMSFEYNGETRAAPGFGSLLSNPAGASSFVRLRNTGSECLNGGGRVEYRLGKRENLKPREYRIGLDAGYVYAFRTGVWSVPGSKVPAPGMPRVKPDHFYVHLTFSGYFDL